MWCDCIRSKAVKRQKGRGVALLTCAVKCVCVCSQDLCAFCWWRCFLGTRLLLVGLRIALMNGECICVYMYTYILCMNLYMYVYTYIYIYIYVCIHEMYTYISCMYIYIYINVSAHQWWVRVGDVVCVCVCAVILCVCAHTAIAGSFVHRACEFFVSRIHLWVVEYEYMMQIHIYICIYICVHVYR